MIYIIDGYNKNEIIEFDPTSNQFTKRVEIASGIHLGAAPSAVAINDKIHIHHGHNNINGCSVACIYCPITDKFEKIKDEFADKFVLDVCLLKDNKNHLMRFGGLNASDYKTIAMDYFL